MGIAIIVLAAKVREADLYDNADDEVKRVGRNAFYLMIIFAVFALALSALGFVTAKWHKWWLVGCVSSLLSLSLFLIEKGKKISFFRRSHI